MNNYRNILNKVTFFLFLCNSEARESRGKNPLAGTWTQLCEKHIFRMEEIYS